MCIRPDDILSSIEPKCLPDLGHDQLGLKASVCVDPEGLVWLMENDPAAREILVFVLKDHGRNAEGFQFRYAE